MLASSRLVDSCRLAGGKEGRIWLLSLPQSVKYGKMSSFRFVARGAVKKTAALAEAHRFYFGWQIRSITRRS